MRNALYVVAPLLFLSLLGAGCSLGKPGNRAPESGQETAGNGAGTTVATTTVVSTATIDFDRRLKSQYTKDRDLDGLLDADETKAGTNPENPDSDADGILDGGEITITKTDPLKADTDGDGMKDGAEILRGRDPLKKDGASAVRSATSSR